MKAPQLKQYRNAWYAYYYIEGKRIRKSLGKDHMIALSRFNQLFQTSSSQPISSVPTDFGKPFSDAVDMYFLSRYNVPGVSTTGFPSSDRSNKTSGLRYLNKLQEHFNIQNVNEITTEKINEFIAHLLTKRSSKMVSRKFRLNYKPNMSTVTVNRYLTFYRAFLNYCSANKWIDGNPADKALIPNMKEDKFEAHAFTSDELTKIYKNSGSYKTFFEFMYETGVRPTDTYFLTKSDFYIKNDRMFIDIITKKTGRRLNVPISITAQQIVEKAKKRVFPIFNTEKDKRDAMKVLRKCFGNRGVGTRFCKANNIVMHSFRHSFAMDKLAKDVPMEIIAELMGHSYTSMTEKYAKYKPKTNLISWI